MGGGGALAKGPGHMQCGGATESVPKNAHTLQFHITKYEIITAKMQCFWRLRFQFLLQIASSVTDLGAWAGEESFNGDGSARGGKLSLHDGSHKRLYEGWRQSPPPLHLIQHLQCTQRSTHTHRPWICLMAFYVNNVIVWDQLGWLTLENRLKQPRWLTIQ